MHSKSFPTPLVAMLATATLGACAGLWPRGSADHGRDAYLLMANPAEDMSNGITIGWHTKVEDTFVEIAPTGDPLSAGGAALETPRRVPGDCEPVRHHDTSSEITYEELKCVARVSGLEPGTEYRYRAGRDSFSPINRFRTAAPGETFSFVYMSDVHVHNPIPRRLETADSSLAVARSLADDIAFTLFAGDMLAYGSAYDAWESLTASDLVRTQMTAFTPGNHDFYDNTAASRGPGYFNTFVYNPDNGAEGVKNTSYFFRFNNLLVISISSEDSWADDAHLENQKRWFHEVVEKNPAEFIVAFTHRPFYNGSTGNAVHARTNRTHWSPIFDELGLDLMLAGHDHVYVRTARTYQGEVSDDPRLGTVYMGSTAVGDRWRDADPENPYENIEAIVGGSPLTLGTIITVGPSSIRIRTYGLDGEIVDQAVLESRRDGVM